MTDLRIQKLNDTTRQTMCIGLKNARLITTASVSELDAVEKASLFDAVRTFDEFTEGNDPHQEHDLGIIEMPFGRFMWKIDYYDQSLQWASEDPADPYLTVRVLTIMYASEY